MSPISIESDRASNRRAEVTLDPEDVDLDNGAAVRSFRTEYPSRYFLRWQNLAIGWFREDSRRYNQGWKIRGALPPQIPARVLKDFI